jgi:hypothetical protein
MCMIPDCRRGRSIAFAVLMAAPAGGSAQEAQVPPRTPPQGTVQAAQPVQPSPAAPVQPSPAAGPPSAQTQPPPQQGAAQPTTQTQPPPQQDATDAPKRLGRPFPAGAVAPPAPPEEPDVSVSVVSPQEPRVFGRRTRSGNQRQGLGDRGRTGNGMGDAGGGLDGRATESEVEAPAE